jgi:hypothetical protein
MRVSRATACPIAPQNMTRAFSVSRCLESRCAVLSRESHRAGYSATLPPMPHPERRAVSSFVCRRRHRKSHRVASGRHLPVQRFFAWPTSLLRSYASDTNVTKVKRMVILVMVATPLSKTCPSLDVVYNTNGIPTIRDTRMLPCGRKPCNERNCLC